MKVFTASFLLLAVVVVAAVAKKSEDDAWKEYKVSNQLKLKNILPLYLFDRQNMEKCIKTLKKRRNVKLFSWQFTVRSRSTTKATALGRWATTCSPIGYDIKQNYILQFKYLATFIDRLLKKRND